MNVPFLDSTPPKAVDPSRPRLALARSSEVHCTSTAYKRRVIGSHIQGWDEGVTEMSLGEKSILTISGYEPASQCTRANLQVLEEMLWQMANPS